MYVCAWKQNNQQESTGSGVIPMSRKAFHTIDLSSPQRNTRVLTQGDIDESFSVFTCDEDKVNRW